MKYIGKCIFGRQNNWENYLGSGVYLKRAIQKYGKSNFKRDILFLAMDDNELEEIEEFIIGYHEAPTNEIFYNLKNTSLGGDTITNHPDREERIARMRVSMTGKRNPMYGVKKSPEMIASVIEANSKEILVDSVWYPSAAEYSRKTGVGRSTIHYRLVSSSFPNYQYADSSRTRKVTRKKRESVVVEIDGIIYKSIYNASSILGISRTTIRKRALDENYPKYRIILKGQTTIESASRDGSE